ncbi:hypothetical protein D3C71_1683150 [compost metagenome]
MQEVGTGGRQIRLAFAVSQRTNGQLTVGVDPAAVGRQDHLLGNGGRGDGLWVLGRTGAEGEGGKAGEQQLGTEHVGLPIGLGQGVWEMRSKRIQKGQQRSPLLGIES